MHLQWWRFVLLLLVPSPRISTDSGEQGRRCGTPPFSTPVCGVGAVAIYIGPISPQGTTPRTVYLWQHGLPL
ncbi:hypothetical protein PAXRUDRAFT_826249 [Paxillus rubicundulus Ve08.2h10]|uniref:Secreted protein n=1 Tax=Paxillus rubicundulus Ve08.2h10 TaxID=930991 RepID=A0A0D0DS69_9AGAM|nr:hypothetical protein PAXRUDRAFT_826249 [Paxillus rubicundulus Ve08.2h10]